MNRLAIVLPGAIDVIANERDDGDRVFLSLITVHRAYPDLVPHKVPQGGAHQQPADQIPLCRVHTNHADTGVVLFLRREASRNAAWPIHFSKSATMALASA